jgi:hypothetical protein
MEGSDMRKKTKREDVFTSVVLHRLATAETLLNRIVDGIAADDEGAAFSAAMDEAFDFVDGPGVTDILGLGGSVIHGRELH